MEKNTHSNLGVEINSDSHYIWNEKISPDKTEQINTDRKSVGIVNSENLDIHTKDPSKIKITLSKNIHVYVYSDKYSEDHPMPDFTGSSNILEMKEGISRTNSDNIFIHYLPESDFGNRETPDNVTILDGIVIKGDITNSTLISGDRNS